MLALLGRHVAEHAEGAADFLFARRVHVAQLLRRAEEGLTLPRAEPFEVFIAADPALALLRRHGVQLMETIDEALLLLLRQGIESLLAAKGVFLAGKGLALMALQPGTQMLAAHVSRRRSVRATRDRVRASRRVGIRKAGTVSGAGHG